MLTILIPTKDRPDFAIRAIQSVLDQDVYAEKISLVVSDNSELNENSAMLSEFCNKNEIFYIRPPQVLSMAQHWDWAFEKVVNLNERITILTDRMLYKSNIFSSIFELINDSDPEIITYPNDSVGFVGAGFCNIFFPSIQTTSGKIKIYESEYLIQNVSECILPMSLPRMLNSIVHINLLKKKKLQYGSYFESISPDFNMCFGLLSVSQRVYYIDRALLISAGLKSSNGATSLNVNSMAARSFQKLSLTNEGLFLTPIPHLMVGVNGILHEFEHIRKTADWFPEPDYYQWYGAIANSMKYANVKDFEGKVALEELFKSDGWKWSEFRSTKSKRASLFQRIATFTRLLHEGKIYYNENVACFSMRSSYSIGPYEASRKYFG